MQCVLKRLMVLAIFSGSFRCMYENLHFIRKSFDRFGNVGVLS